MTHLVSVYTLYCLAIKRSLVFFNLVFERRCPTGKNAHSHCVRVAGVYLGTMGDQLRTLLNQTVFSSYIPKNKPNLDCNHTFPTDLAPNGNRFKAKFKGSIKIGSLIRTQLRVPIKSLNTREYSRMHGGFQGGLRYTERETLASLTATRLIGVVLTV